MAHYQWMEVSGRRRLRVADGHGYVMLSEGDVAALVRFVSGGER